MKWNPGAHRIVLVIGHLECYSAGPVKIVQMISCATLLAGGSILLAGCQKTEPFPAPGNSTPVNESAMPAPDLSATETETMSTGTSSPAEPSGTPAPTPVPSPAPVTAAPSPGT